MVYIGFESTTTQDDSLSEGCRLCTLGAKMVLFVTGLCPRSCFYCPLTPEKISSPVLVNERKVYTDNDVIEEAYSMDALGTGITGGEPLLRLDDVLHYIQVLKNEFGDIHHIHLYTSQAPSYEILDSLASAGLDEIRFHPPMAVWDSISESAYRRCMGDALKLGMDVGIEIPAIRNIPAIVALVEELGCFLNLNELEFTEANADNLKTLGYKICEDSNAAIGSSDIARTIIAQTEAHVHFCPSAFKDAVQFRERLKRKAKIYARPFDEITPDGTIVYG
ncbi:MAG: radical SAM protein, partial [Methanosarcinales archaeon]|nr:radical SAM protein [Methanosarcinales archaeon]